MNILSFMITVILTLIFNSAAVIAANNNFSENEVGDFLQAQYCVCVPFWQCKEDYSGLIEDEIELIDLRFVRSYSNSACTGDFDVCCQIECGRRLNVIDVSDENANGEDVFRILGENNEAEVGEFPWMLGILQNKAYRCGAALLHPQVAITAAHCVSNPGPYKVRAGEWNWEIQTEHLPHQDRMTKKVLIHQNYNPSSLQNDIALLILDAPFKLAENVGIVCLPPPKARFDGANCVVSGWGKNSFRKGSYQPTLKKLKVPVVPRRECLKALQDVKLGPYFQLHHSFICAGGEDKDTCKGDGGSPLMCPIEGHFNRYQQVGIVSWGLTCGVHNTPGVYVNLAEFRTWIDRQMLFNNFDSNMYQYNKFK